MFILPGFTWSADFLKAGTFDPNVLEEGHNRLVALGCHLNRSWAEGDRFTFEYVVPAGVHPSGHGTWIHIIYIPLNRGDYPGAEVLAHYWSENRTERLRLCASIAEADKYRLAAYQRGWREHNTSVLITPERIHAHRPV